MGNIYLNSENSKTSDHHGLLPNLSDKTHLKRSDKNFALSNLSCYYTWKNIKKLPDEPYSVSDIRDYFEDILIKDMKFSDNPSIIIYVNKIENRITFKIEAVYYIQLLTPETMKLLGSTKSKITKNVDGKNVPRLEIAVVILVCCNTVNNDYQQDSRDLYTFVPNKSLGQLVDISPKNCIF